MTSLHSLDEMLRATRRSEPWALARFNDGEIAAMQRLGPAVARGDQPCTRALSRDLKWCIQQRAFDLWLGRPCSLCWPKHRAVADELMVGHTHLTSAVVQTNRNRRRRSGRMTTNGGGDHKSWHADTLFSVVRTSFRVTSRLA